MIQWDRMVGSLLRFPQMPGSTNRSVGSLRFFIAKLLLLFELQHKPALSLGGRPVVPRIPAQQASPLGPKAQLGGCSRRQRVSQSRFHLLLSRCLRTSRNSPGK